MLVQALLSELRHEAENTRKLFDAISNDVLDYKPNDFNWTIAELASHVTEVYYWWDSTLNQDALEMSNYKYDKGDISDIRHIKARLEENIAQAIATLENYPEEKLMEPWKMTSDGREIFPPTPRAVVVRGFLMSHLYHHRGELIAYLRVNHKPVPGLYGPSYEEMQAMMS